jgi:mannose-6-phosphate isomerase-like protein (cupin superfamily)
MEVKSTLRVINQADIEGHVGVIPGQSMKRLVGCAEVPTDRVRVGLATYAPGSIEELHWHPIESFYFVISGHATVRNFEGEEFEVGPGCAIYAPPGIAGAHEWKSRKRCRSWRCARQPNPTRKCSSPSTRKPSALTSISTSSQSAAASASSLTTERRRGQPYIEKPTMHDLKP